MKLALVSPSTTSPVISTNTVKPAPKISVADTNSGSLAVTQSTAKINLPATTALHPTDDPQSTAAVKVVIQKSPESTGLFSGQGGNGSFGFANIQAGYGQVYDSDSIVLRGRNGTAWEETRYIFFKKVVKF